MSISILVQSTAEQPGGTAFILSDYTDIVTDAELTSQRFDAPGKLAFSCVEKGRIHIEMGSAVTLMAGTLPLFKGYVFTAERNRFGETTYTAYDQLRYLKANASYTFEAMTLGQMIAQIAADFGLEVLQYYNRVLQTLTIEGLGVAGIRAGAIVPVRIGAVEDLSVSRLLLAEKVTHKFESGGHTMSIEVKDFVQLGGIEIG